jgi:hypothetical protein
MLFTYMINQQMHIINMLNHMLLFLANMFHSPLWPSSVSNNNNTTNIQKCMIKLLSVILNCHIDWEAKQVEKCTGMLKYTKLPKFVFWHTSVSICWRMTHFPHTWSLSRVSSSHFLQMKARNISNKMHNKMYITIYYLLPAGPVLILSTAVIFRFLWTYCNM